MIIPGTAPLRGEFRDGTIGDWKEDALAVVERLTEGPVVIIGSSMGGWIGLLVGLEVRDRLSAFIGIAPAPDFTRELMWESYSPEIQEKLKRDGVYYEPSQYSGRTLCHQLPPDRGRGQSPSAWRHHRPRVPGAAAGTA